MSSSKRTNYETDRNALFGPPKKGSATPTGPKHKRENEANRDALFGGAEKKTSGSRTRPGAGTSATSKTKSSSSPSTLAPPSGTSNDTNNLSRGYTRDAKPKVSSTLTGSAKMAKLKEAENFRDQATKLMQRGLFTRPDPVMAANYYKRAADAYGLCGENRLERLHRVASADCQMGNGSYASAASEYARAGALAKESNEELERRRKEGWKFYSDAAVAWTKANEPGKAANCQVLSALAWTWDDDTTVLDTQALTSLEQAVEAHVPDVLNAYARYRQTGSSQFIDPNNRDAVPSEETMNLAREHMVKTPYAHEPLQEVTHTLVHYGEYRSALYACGAATALLEADGVSTLTLGRNYVSETILAVAMGDPVMAEKQFLDRHVQKTHYLTSRECKLAEDLFRAVLSRDPDALEEARAPTGSNKNAMANLHASLRGLVQNLRISGAARRQVPDVAKPSAKKAPIPVDDDDSSTEERPKHGDTDGDLDNDNEVHNLDPERMKSEMDDIMAGMDELEGLGDTDDDDDLDDDDIDLR